jgi:hypothetical protein
MIPSAIYGRMEYWNDGIMDWWVVEVGENRS